jgi:hypothetical protein
MTRDCHARDAVLQYSRAIFNPSHGSQERNTTPKEHQMQKSVTLAIFNALFAAAFFLLLASAGQLLS